MGSWEWGREDRRGFNAEGAENAEKRGATVLLVKRFQESFSTVFGFRAWR
jgi:hypothetical protein